MRHRRAVGAVVVFLLVATTGLLARQGQESRQKQDEAMIEHAKQVLELLRAEKFAEVTQQFDTQMYAVFPESQLAATWATFVQKVGAFKSLIDDRVTKPASGITAVTLGCQFEKAAVNMIIAFSPDGKIVGLRLSPRQAKPEPGKISSVANTLLPVVSN